MELRDGSTTNPPGQDEIAYRTSTHHEVFTWLLDALGDPDRRGLATLTTRDRDDLTIGLLDAFATMTDVLGFYQERIANEHYLGTATERLSVRALAELVNFQLAPGKSADCLLYTSPSPRDS